MRERRSGLVPAFPDAGGFRPDFDVPFAADTRSGAVAGATVFVPEPGAEDISKRRGATSERVDAQARNTGLWRVLVRGL